MASTVTRQKDYSDLDLDFRIHPIRKDIMKKTGPDAIIRSIRNLVFTNFYDRPFQHSIGSSALKLLFDNANPMIANMIEEHIMDLIKNFEPRATLITVKAFVSPDDNGVIVKIIFLVNNRPEPVVTTVFLERIR